MSDRDFFDSHAVQTRIGLVNIGAHDKSPLKFLIGVGKTVADTGLSENETIDGVTRTVAVVCPLSVEEMRAVLQGLFDAGFFRGAFDWQKGRDDNFHHWLFYVAVADHRVSAEIATNGVSEFRKILGASIHPDNIAAKRALNPSGG
jgi:hypothetical protein